MTQLDETGLIFRVNDNPNFLITIFLALQQILVCGTTVLAMPLFLMDLFCASDDAALKVKLIGLVLITVGISTFLQTTIGTRLPIIQGPNFTYLAVIISMISQPEFQCSSFKDQTNSTTFGNASIPDRDGQLDETVSNRMQQLQGAIIAAGTIEFVIGFTGLVGLLSKFLGPLTIAPLMLLLQFSVMPVCLKHAQGHWISLIVFFLVILCSMYLHKTQIPVMHYSRTKHIYFRNYPIFSMFPYLIAVLVTWSTCAIVTSASGFSHVRDELARTDRQSEIFSKAPYVQFFLPGHWGGIRFNIGVFIGMLAATVASVVESVGDYYGCAAACHENRPPLNVLNRGIMVEGFCCILSGLFGAGVAVTSYSENVGALGITKATSRSIFQVAGILFVLFGTFAKFGALLSTIPYPIVGGVMTVGMSFIGGIGLSSLQRVNLKLFRNTAILGLSIMMGYIVPQYISNQPLSTGFTNVDSALNILLGTPPVVGSLFGFILDNTVPGASLADRGISVDAVKEGATSRQTDAYSFPPAVMKWLDKCPASEYLPFLPTYSQKRNYVKESVVYSVKM